MTAIELRRTALFCVLFGLYLTLRGYHSFEGDQAYRFPILKHAQDFRLYADDPFVRSFDHFNPHRGYFALLDRVSWPWGLATAVFLLYAMTCAVTAAGVDRLGAGLAERGSGRRGGGARNVSSRASGQHRHEPSV